MTCCAKHTKYQPTEEEWICPKCGATAEEDFIISDVTEEANEDCNLLHIHDLITCGKCGKGYTGSSLITALTKKINMEPCPCCNGKGFVKKKVIPDVSK